jgi:hypothetical protein
MLVCFVLSNLNNNKQKKRNVNKKRKTAKFAKFAKLQSLQWAIKKPPKGGWIVQNRIEIICVDNDRLLSW